MFLFHPLHWKLTFKLNALHCRIQYFMQKCKISICTTCCHKSKKVQCCFEKSHHFDHHTINNTQWSKYDYTAVCSIQNTCSPSVLYMLSNAFPTSGGKVECPQMWAISPTKQQDRRRRYVMMWRWKHLERLSSDPRQKKALFYIVKPWHRIMEGQGQGGTSSCGKCPHFWEQSKLLMLK